MGNEAQSVAGVGRWAGRRETNRAAASEGAIDDVATKIVGPLKYRKILFTTPRSRRVELVVEASDPVKVFAVYADDIDRFRDGDRFEGLEFKPTKDLRQKVRLPFRIDDDWYLVMENDGDQPVAVHYEVYDV